MEIERERDVCVCEGEGGRERQIYEMGGQVWGEAIGGINSERKG